MVTPGKPAPGPAGWKPLSMDEMWESRARLAAEQPWKPVGRARAMWSIRWERLKLLRLPREQQRTVAPMVRRAAVYEGVGMNLEAVRRYVVWSLPLIAALAVAAVAAARPHGPADVATMIGGLLTGALATAAVFGGLVHPADALTLRWPELGNGVYHVHRSLQVLAAVLGGAYAAGRPAGFLTGMAWAIPAFVLVTIASETLLKQSGRRWHGRHNKRGALAAALATQQLVVVAAALAEDRAAWRTAARSAALARKLRQYALRIPHHHRRLATERPDRSLARARGRRLSLAVMGYRADLVEVTNQGAYDRLLARAKADVVALAGQDWEVLPAAPPKDTQTTLATAVSTAILGLAAGLAVNAASEHLPSVLGRPSGAWAAAVACTIIVIVFRRKGWGA